MGITEVTKSTFDAALPKVLKHIDAASFISFDTEFSGLQSTKTNKYYMYDTIAERYAKLRDSGSNFALFQVGLTCFYWKASKQKYSYNSYSFYLFPSIVEGIQDKRYMIQMSSMAFLAEHQFDFNKAFTQGIPFLSQKEEQFLRDKNQTAAAIGTASATKTNDRQISLKEDDRTFIDKVSEEIDAWIANMHANQSLEIGPFNSFQRFLLYQTLPEKYSATFPNKQLVLEKSTVATMMKVSFLSEQDRTIKFAEAQKQFQVTLAETAGFRKIIDRIVDQQKPIVGHNCWLDLCHFYAKFFEPLPSSFTEFCLGLSQRFPIVIDTKYLATLVNEFSGTNNSLSDLVGLIDRIHNLPLATIKEERQVFHDAGFDSLCTGKVFIGLVQLLMKQFNNKLPINKCIEESIFSSQLEAKPHLAADMTTLTNRLFMMVSDFSFVALDLSKQIYPNRGFLCLLLEIPPNTQTSTIIQVFEGSGFPNVSVHWINQTSAHVRFENDERAETAARLTALQLDPKEPASPLYLYSDLTIAPLQLDSSMSSVPEKRKSPSPYPCTTVTRSVKVSP